MSVMLRQWAQAARARAAMLAYVYPGNEREEKKPSGHSQPERPSPETLRKTGERIHFGAAQTGEQMLRQLALRPSKALPADGLRAQIEKLQGD